MNGELFCIRVRTGASLRTFVAGGATWDGSWMTNNPATEIVKTWKTRAGAERWLAQRPGIVGEVMVSDPVYHLHAGRDDRARRYSR